MDVSSIVVREKVNVITKNGTAAADVDSLYLRPNLLPLVAFFGTLDQFIQCLNQFK